MRAIAASFLLFGLVPVGAEGADRRDQLFASWQEALRGVKSLVVEFTLETWDPVVEKREKAEGTFRMIRTPKGEVFASSVVSPVNAKADEQGRCSGLLHNGTVYLLDHARKTAIRFDPAGADLRRFLEKYFNPFVRLLDRKRAEEQCHIEVVGQDKWYTYLSVRPKQIDQSGWFPDSFHKGRVVLMNRASGNVPKDMPRRLWYTDGVREYTIEIKSWRLNAGGAPKVEEFSRPESRPGWKVTPWLWSEK